MKFIHGQTIRTTFLFLFIVSIINIVHYIQTREQIFLLSFLTTTIASCFYLYFTYKQATPIHIRYFDWIVTTPILLWELCILTDINDMKDIGLILFLNILVFVFGWMGERNIISKKVGCVFGFIPFILLFSIFLTKGQYSPFIPFFIVVWTLYGLNYLLSNNLVKNTFYNILDSISKGLFSILLL